jgi:hypothetical protein
MKNVKKETFKEFVEAMALRRHIKKGMVVLIKIFDRNEDGPWNVECKPYSRLDRKYVEVRIGDILQERTQDRYMMSRDFDLPNDKYLAAVVVTEGTKKYNTLVELGFEPAIDLKERRNDILKAKVS